MTPSALRQALARYGSSWPTDPLDLLAAVEARAESLPGHPHFTALLLAAELQATAPERLPEGLHRDELVRFDNLSATWTAHDADGARYLVRVARADLRPPQRRVLERDGKALVPLVTGLRTASSSLIAPLVGDAVAGPLPRMQAIRLVATTFGALSRWEDAGLFPLAPHTEELRQVDGEARLVVLTPGLPQLQPWVRHLAVTLRPEGFLGALLRGLVELPAPTVADAETRLRHALADDLAARTVALWGAHQQRMRRVRQTRLAASIARLRRALPPPPGRGAVGFDLDGRPTEVWSDGTRVGWGRPDQPQVVFDGEAFDAPAARRLLRALAIAPITSDSFCDPIGRWVAAGLRLRTYALLLERSP